MMTLQDALTAYKKYVKAEGKNDKTITWITSSTGYFTDFLGQERQIITGITGNDFRRFMIALRNKQKFSNHPNNKTQEAKLSPYTINTYYRGVRCLFSFLYRENFIDNNPLVKVKGTKLPELIVPTFSEKELQKLQNQPDK